MERLLWKYRMLASLRARREAVEREGLGSFGLEEGRERKRLFRRIAREFPGALRELDSFTAAELDARRAEVERACEELRAGNDIRHRGGWIELILDFHRTLREALMVKRWLALRLPKGGAITEDLVDAYADRRARLERLRVDRAEGGAALDADGLTRHLRPPGGRLVALVWETLEDRHGRPRSEMEARLFGLTLADA